MVVRMVIIIVMGIVLELAIVTGMVGFSIHKR